jgi:hypothetical protein
MTQWGKLAPSLGVAEKIQPYFIFALDDGSATAFRSARLAGFSLAMLTAS